MKFGIWIEPEMINEDSDLYRAHPDWAIQIPGKKRMDADAFLRGYSLKPGTVFTTEA